MKRRLQNTFCNLPIFILIIFFFVVINEADCFSNYDIGNPIVTNIWVDPNNGNDSNNGLTRSQALASLREAWSRIPAGTTLSGTGYRIMLAAGNYYESILPDSGWLESRFGTNNFPVIIQSADDVLSAHIHGYFNIYNCRYFYLIGLDFITDPGAGGGGNVVHIEQGNHILLKNCKLNGFDGNVNQPQETIKVNQSQYIYVENNDIGGAYWFSLDYVAVQYGHIIGNKIHNSGDDCMVLKGGTAYLNVEDNEVYDCGNIGFAAGQGTGFEFMVNPWIHYEIYDVKFVNNIVHDANNAGMAVRGGYNILLAYNTLYKVGTSGIGAPLLLLSPGLRGCDGNEAACRIRNEAGGWGPISGDAGECIPNKNIYVYNNIFYNPAPYQTRWSHFDIYGPVNAPVGTNIPNPVLSDNNVRIRGNIIWNGPVDHSLGLGEPGQGGQSDNPTCNVAQVLADNTINTIQPEFTSPLLNNYHPIENGNIFNAHVIAIPDFSGGDRASPPLAPIGDFNNAVISDYDGRSRDSLSLPGAFTGSLINVPDTVWYLPEGCTNGFDEFILIMNPNVQAANIKVTFMKPDGSTTEYTSSVLPTSRKTIYVNSYVPNNSVSAKVESLNGISIYVERAMYWNTGNFRWGGGHDSTAISELASEWYFAEGCTNGFDEFILIINPNNQNADILVQFMLPNGNLIERHIEAAATSRYTIHVNDIISNSNVSVKIISNIPVAAERAMYWSSGGYHWIEGHDAPGVSVLSTEWYLAEGCTAGFDEWVLIMNPNQQNASVNLRFMKNNGTVVDYPITVSATSRYTVHVNDIIRNESISTYITSDIPIVAERAMYWDAGGMHWAGGHISQGVQSAGTTWLLPEGCTGGESNFDTWVLIMNPNNQSSSVTLTFMLPDGTTSEHFITVNATSRFTIHANDYVSNNSFSTKITSNIPIIAERAVYWDSEATAEQYSQGMRTIHWKGGHDSVGYVQ